MDAESRSGLPMREVIAVWVGIGLSILAVLVTYSRFPAEAYYHVTREGLAGGLGQALVVSNFPFAFVAIALTLVSLARLWELHGARLRSAFALVAAVSILFCGAAAVTVDQANLDARAINVIPAIGVVLSLGMTWVAVRRGGAGEWHPWRALDWLSLAVSSVAIVMSLPVIVALAGIYTADIPLLRSIYMSRGFEDGVQTVYVHVGEHHGYAGLFMMISGLALARVVVVIRPAWLRMSAGWYVSLLTIYGATNMVQDFWGEQLVKRGTTDHTIPNMLRPALTIQWLYVAVGMVIFWFVYFRLVRDPTQQVGERPAAESEQTAVTAPRVSGRRPSSANPGRGHSERDGWSSPRTSSGSV